MGVRFQERRDGLEVTGVGLRGLRSPDATRVLEIDCGNSGTTMRLLCGLLSAQPFQTLLSGDASLSRRPMRRVIAPLTQRGAHITGRGEGADIKPPLHILGLSARERLDGLEYIMPVASAQVKSALLLSGLYANGVTLLKEPVISRDHTERMLLALGVPIQTSGPMVMLDPAAWQAQSGRSQNELGWNAFEWQVPGDFSSAAFYWVAAAIVPQSDIKVSGVGVNPTRTGLLDAFRQAGLSCQVWPRADAAGGEPTADVEVRHSPSRLRSVRMGGELLTRAIDEVPALAVLGVVCQGLEIRDAAELRVKESDRIRKMVEVLSAFGVPCEEHSDGFTVLPSIAPLRAARVDSSGDHRIAMAAVLLGMLAQGETMVEDVECVATSFPGFAAGLRAMGAAIDDA